MPALLATTSVYAASSGFSLQHRARRAGRAHDLVPRWLRAPPDFRPTAQLFAQRPRLFTNTPQSSARLRPGMATRLAAAEAASSASAAPPPPADILCGLDGEPFPLELFSQAVQALEGPSGGGAPEVTAVTVEEGSENRFPTSHSAVLRLTLAGPAPPARLFIKKVTEAAMAHKGWVDRRRTLLYARNELRFYEEFGPALAAHGVHSPRPACLLQALQALGPAELADPAGEEPSAAELAGCGAAMVLECAGAGAVQASPLPPEQACAALRAVARLHGAAWEDTALLAAAADRLQRHGGSFALSIRNPAELKNLEDNWARFVEAFRPEAPELFARPAVQDLGRRLRASSASVAAQLAPLPGDPCATLIHGDFKAMNVFLPAPDSREQQPMLIDFASTGVGLGMADVAMHLSHSVAPADLADGGEARMLDAYLEALAEARGPGASEYPRFLALHHYRLAVVDYGRFVVSRFWTNASPEAFEAKANSPNTTLVNRDVKAALAFVERMDACLEQLEREG